MHKKAELFAKFMHFKNKGAKSSIFSSFEKKNKGKFYFILFQPFNSWSLTKKEEVKQSPEKIKIKIKINNILIITCPRRVHNFKVVQYGRVKLSDRFLFNIQILCDQLTPTGPQLQQNL